MSRTAMRETFSNSPLTIRVAGCLAFAITAFQILILLCLAPRSETFSARYLKLDNWDSTHYINIATEGYHLPNRSVEISDIHEDRANVVFFPGFPMLSRSVSRLTGASIAASLLIVSHISCLIFWFLFLLLMRSYGVSGRNSLTAVLALLAYPATFYLALGYTESLFMVGVLLYIYFSDRGRYLNAVFGGALATVTRIVGIAIAPYPVLRKIGEKMEDPGASPTFYKEVLVGILSVSGAAAFFIFWQIRFSDWRIYFKLEEMGWQTHRNVWSIFNPLSYFPRFFFEDTVLSINRLSVTFTAYLFFVAYRMEKFARGYWRRMGLYFVGVILFYIAFTVKADANMDSMMRYALPTYILFLLAFSQIWQQKADFQIKRGWKVTALVFAAIQVWLAYRFLKGKWIA